MDAEHKTLIAAMTLPLGAGAVHLAGQMPETLNWDRLLNLAQKHRAIPFLAALVHSCEGPVPDVVRESVERSFHVHVARNTFMTEALLGILESLRIKGIRAIPLRGPLLSVRLYGDPIYRQCDDLDLLLETDSLMQVKQILVDQGYRPHYTMSPEVEALSVRSGWEIILKSPDDRFSVELHTQLTPGSYGIRIPMSEWWNHVETWQWQGRCFLTFSPSWLYLANMIHAAKHLWARIGWLGDLYALERVCGREMMDEAKAIAGRYGIRRMVDTGRALVTRIIGESGSIKTDRDAAVPPGTNDGLVARLESRVISMNAGRLTERLRIQAQLRDGLWDSSRYLMAEVGEPSYRDWLSYPALRRMPWLFYVWRPLRLARDAVAGCGRFSSRSQG